MPPNRHWSWDFYESFPTNPKLAKCQGCGRQYSNGSVSRMTKHLKSCDKFDPTIKAEITTKVEAEPVSTKASSHPYNRNSSTLPNDDSEDLCKTLEEVIKAATSMPMENVNSEENGFNFSGFQLFNNGHNFPDSEQANRLLAMFFKSGYISTNFVENEDFVKFIHVLNPNYVLPSKKELDKLTEETDV